MKTKKRAVTLLNEAGISFDYAVPQNFADDFRSRTGKNLAEHAVWIYPKHSIFGCPLPLSLVAWDFMTAGEKDYLIANIPFLSKIIPEAFNYED